MINKSSSQLHQENERGINQIINLGGQNADHIIEEFGKEEGGIRWKRNREGCTKNYEVNEWEGKQISDFRADWEEKINLPA